MADNDNSSAIDEKEMLAALAGSGSGASVDPTQFRQTDAGNADLFVAMFGDNLRYVELWRTWMLWNRSRWIEASDIALTPFAKAATEHIFEWAKTLPEDERAGWRKHATRSQSRDHLRAMIDLAKGNLAIRAEPCLFDADPMLLGCEGMTFDLRKRKPHPPRREDYITKTTGITPDKNAACPEWLALLDWVFNGDVATIEHLQRVAGYMLTGDVSEEKLFCFFGGGSNGKTTIAMTLFDILGDYAGKARGTLLMEAQGEKGAASPDVAALHGKRFVIVSETDDQCSLAEAQVKSITSNEPITARRLHRDPFTFMPTHKTLLMTNHRPFVKGTDDGIWRRLGIVGFEHQIAEANRIADFRETKLKPELPAILVWAIRGCLMWQKDGLKPSPAVIAATASYKSDMDFVAQWIADRVILDPTARTPRTAAYGDYETWAKLERAPILGPRRFGEELHRRGFPATRSHGARVVHGIRLKLGVSLHVIPAGPPSSAAAAGP